MKLLLLFVASILMGSSFFAQSIILNEVSNGPDGSKEYMEFVVMDTAVVYNCGLTTPPCIDIRGWIFDDNSGYHGTAGIAGGAMRFSFDDRWSCVPVGTIILVYNDGDPNPLIPAMDTSLVDGNCTFIAPISDINLFESNLTTPGAIACSYPATGWVAGGTWTRISLANTTDCARIVDLAGCEVFSLCWNANNLNNMIYFTGTGTDDVWYFNDVDPYSQANWSEGCADVANCGTEDQTPGLPNNAANAAYIGQFNNNCAPIPPIIASAIVNSDEICGCDGSATASASGSIAGYTFEWFDIAYTAIGQTTALATGLCAGTYNVIATSSIGCSDTATIVIAPGAAVPVVSIDNPGPFCSDDASFILTENGGDAVSWTWSSDGSATIGLTTDQDPTITNAVNGEIFTVIGTDGSGCFASAQTTIVIDSAYAILDTIITCQNMDVTYHDGITETITGNTSHISNLFTVAGCDSIFTTTVIMNPIYNIIVTDSICDGGLYTYSDGFSETVTSSTSHVSNLLTTENCDSIITTNVFMNPIYSIIVTDSICDGGLYTYPDGFSETVTSSTSHVSNLLTTENCDSIITTNVFMNPIYSIIITDSICDGGLYTYPDGFSETVTSSTSHVSNLLTTENCDSIITTNVFMNPTFALIQNFDVCPGANFTYPDGTNSTNILADESHVSNLITTEGCDSIITTNLTLNSVFTSSENVPICFDSDYTYPDGTSSTNIIIDESHVSTFVSTLGCDSLVTTNLTVNPIYNLIVLDSICDGGLYTYPDGFSETVSGNTSHVSNLLTAANCDSIITTNVFMNPIYNIVVTDSICDGGLYTYPDGFSETVTSSTSHVSNLLTTENCDSIITTNVFMNPIYNIIVTDSICDGGLYTYPDGFSETVTSSTSHVSNLLTTENCDSIITTNVFMNPIYSIIVTDSICDGGLYTYPDGFSETVTSSTSHVSNLLTTENCDSIITTNVFMNPIYSIIITDSICDGGLYTYPDGFSETVTSSTSHVSNLLTTENCDSIITTNVFMNPTFALIQNFDVCPGANFTYPDGTNSTNILADESHVSNLITTEGCDSIITTNLTLNSVFTSSENVPICFGSDYTYPDGTSSTNIIIDESHVSTFVSTLGCDSLVTTNLTVNPIYNLIVLDSICDGGLYTYPDGFSETVSGNTSHVSNLLTAANCDSIITTSVFMNPSYNIVVTDSICDGGLYTYPDGFSETITGNSSHISNLLTTENCDSIITTNVTMNPDIIISESFDVCSGSSYTYPDGFVSSNITTDESHISNLFTTLGCDSIITTNITVVSVLTTSESYVICEGSDYTYPDGTISTNILVDESHSSLFTSVSGCDSVVTTQLEISPVYNITSSLSVCENSIVTYPDGTTEVISASTSQTSVFISVGGCDSTIITNVTMFATPSEPIAGTDSEYCSTVDFETMTATASAGGNLTWYSDPTLLNNISVGSSLVPENVLGETVYYVTETVNGCEGPASQVIITVNQCGITIPTAFTPDGDGSNDDWEILDLDLAYPNNVVFVYNRWGNLLFESVQGDYDNHRWDGTYKGKEMPIGSYYFIIEFNNVDNDKATGAVSIILNK